jgi:hypothetical protein
MVGGFDHGGHGMAVVGSCAATAGGLRDPASGYGLHHSSTTSMVACPDLGPHALSECGSFFILKKWSFVSAGNNRYLKVAIFGILRLVSASIADTNNMFTADIIDPFCSSAPGWWPNYRSAML